MDWSEYNGKKVYLKLKGGREYQGIVNEVSVTDEKTFMRITDRYNKPVRFQITEIKIIQEERR